MRKWFSGIRVKLLIVSIFASISLLVVGGIGFFAIAKLTQKLEVAYNERLKLVDYLGEMESGLHATFRWLWVAHANDDNPKERQKFILRTQKTIKELEVSIANYLALPRVEKAKVLFDERFAPNWEKSKKIIEEIIVELEKNDPQFSRTAKIMIMTKLRPTFTPVNEALTELHNTANDVNKKIVIESLNYAKQVKTSTVLIIVIATIFSFVLSIYIIGQLVKTLSLLVNDLNHSAEQVSSASSQIASSSEELSQATTEQASSLQESSSSIEEISSMINANSENAKRSRSISGDSLQTAERGRTVIEQMVKAIKDIDTSNAGIVDQIAETNKEIENIVKIINEIGSKTKVINDIVFQTKLLSFNASVEAARAGEQGKGFAVVAEEVGNLAAMSGAAALEITTILEGSIRTVENIVTESKRKIGSLILHSKDKVEVGTRVAHECEEVLSEVITAVASVSKIVVEIASASQEQATGVQEITKAMAMLDQVTQENTATSADSANAAGVLSAQAEALNSLVQKLVQTIEGGNVVLKNTSANKKIVTVSKVVEKVTSKKNPDQLNSNSVLIKEKNQKNNMLDSGLPSSADQRFEDV